ncbi:tRNA-dihydrouridine(47) synthase [NAD(P)(+)]-like [Uranotaenia lowii]|uniref:tRNA-dihydrouridine(47) synthase [NAD(P)(+)]-like n=1 Tax=Uranotaenia lowii TaxID=190385 RepID=UPI00247A4E2E|nr:tRNA-dihydrouridine(47) synthase [NAD(P)(+)]-like [Uranotaenia lowii]
MDETVCYIKPEYLVPRNVGDNDSSNKVEEGNGQATEKRSNEQQSSTEEPPKKKGRYADDRKNKKKNRGQNKNRGLPFKEDHEARLCKSLNNGPDKREECGFANCRFSHDISKYMQLKPKDIGETCYIYSLKGRCPFGVTCRFGSGHLDENFNNITNENVLKENEEITLTRREKELKRKNYDFKKSDEVLKKFEMPKGEDNEDVQGEALIKRFGSCPEEDLIVLRDAERRKIVFRDKLYLSPLTTVGNLPFRRICKEYGVDITCGEMACAIPLVKGINSEWALTKRHSSEDLFGVQLCGHSAKLLTYASELVADSADVDFIDLNLGCPIDLIFQQGAGSALLRRKNRLMEIIPSVTRLLHEYGKEFTIKTRVGVYKNSNIAHKFIPMFEELGASLVTVHGRSKEQRYTKNADWEYIRQCAQQAKSIPVFGNGDIYNYADYEKVRQDTPEIAGVMIGRGALIKPWIFQEIKDQKPSDPSSSERMEMLKRFVNYGLEHWGSDTKGVESTRRFFLEWQSFLYRYVPYGLLERPPQKINQRPELFRGRDDLETLMASPNCADWVKLSEMLLGPVPDGFNFLPKHKANAY